MSRALNRLLVLAVALGTAANCWASTALEQPKPALSLSFSTGVPIGVLSPYVYGEWVEPGREPLVPIVGAAPIFVEIPWRFSAPDESREAVLNYLRAGAQICLSFDQAAEARLGALIEAAGSFPEVRLFSIPSLDGEATASVAWRIGRANPGSTVLVRVRADGLTKEFVDLVAARPSLMGIALPAEEQPAKALADIQEVLVEFLGGVQLRPVLLSRRQGGPGEFGPGRATVSVLLSRLRAPQAPSGQGPISLLLNLLEGVRDPTVAVSLDLTGCDYAEQARSSLAVLAREARCHGWLFGRQEADGALAVAAGEPFRAGLCLLNNTGGDVTYDVTVTDCGGFWSRRLWPLPAAEPVVEESEASLHSDGKRPLVLRYTVKPGAGRVVVLRNDLSWAYREMHGLLWLLTENLRGDKAGLESLVAGRAAMERAILESGAASAAHETALIHVALARLDEAAVLIGPAGAGALAELSADMAAETERALEALHGGLSQASADYLGLGLTYAARQGAKALEVEVHLANGNVAGLDDVSLSLRGPVGWRVRSAGETSVASLAPGHGIAAVFTLEPREPQGSTGVAVLRAQYRIKQGRALLSRSIAVRPLAP